MKKYTFEEIWNAKEPKKLSTNGVSHNVMCRTCKTCGHKEGSRCNLGGYYISTERRYPTLCGKDFDKWIPNPPKLGLKNRLRAFWYGT